jgi:murein tripeptide amidase MpaA
MPPGPSNSWLFTVPSFAKIIDQYPRYPTILRWFDELARHPNISRFFGYEVVGRTHENRSMIVAKIGLMPFRTLRRSVWVDGGIHAREWISTSTVLYSMARLINGTLARDDDVRKLIDTYDFYFMPVVNPDGYAYTHDDVKKVWDSPEQQEQQRMWRKNRRPHDDCPGVDLNRNFAFAWDNRGASKFPW